MKKKSLGVTSCLFQLPAFLYFLVILLLVLFSILVARSYFKDRFRLPPDNDLLFTYGKASVPAFSEKVKVLVWNIHKGKDDEWDRDLSRLSEDTELILLQEAVTAPKMLELFRQSKDHLWNYAASFAYGGEGETTGVAIGSRVLPEGVGFLRSTGREPLVGTPKMTIYAHFPLRFHEETLLVVNIHSNLLVREADYEAQVFAAAGIIRKHSGPVLWAGDFNTWSKGREGIVFRQTKELGLRPVVFESDARTTLFGYPLDHAFVRGLEVVSSRVYGELESSDHKALEFVLEVLDLD
jgi:endonuclease/exonuclease/phosphatase (EEP) superfamily protein YafD